MYKRDHRGESGMEAGARCEAEVALGRRRMKRRGVERERLSWFCFGEGGLSLVLTLASLRRGEVRGRQLVGEDYIIAYIVVCWCLLNSKKNASFIDPRVDASTRFPQLESCRVRF